MSARRRRQRWLKTTLLPWLATPLLKALVRSWQVEFIGAPSLAALSQPRKIVAVWHGRLLLTACILRDWDIHVMVSDHEDGEMIARIVERMGYHAVRGSSSRGGVKAARGSVEAIAQGRIGGMLPDGPTGPRHRAKLGTVWLAREADAAIVPVSGSAARHWRFLRSWDKHLVPKPFARVAFCIGEPLTVATGSGAALRDANRRLETVLTDLERRCDDYCGVPFMPEGKSPAE